MLKTDNYNQLHKNAYKICLFLVHESYIKYSRYTYSALLIKTAFNGQSNGKWLATG